MAKQKPFYISGELFGEQLPQHYIDEDDYDEIMPYAVSITHTNNLK